MNYRSGMMLIGSKSGKKEANLEKNSRDCSVQEMLCFPVSTSFRIMIVTFSFLIRFE